MSLQVGDGRLSIIPEINGKVPRILSKSDDRMEFEGGWVEARDEHGFEVFGISAGGKVRLVMGRLDASKVFVPRPPKFYYRARGKISLSSRQTSHFYFSPPPQIFCIQTGGRWIGIGLCGMYGIDGISSNFGRKFFIETEIRGRPPEFVLLEGSDEWDVLRNYTNFLKSSGRIRGDMRIEDWWTRAMYCTWGDQMEAGGNILMKNLGCFSLLMMDLLPERICERIVPRDADMQRMNLVGSKRYYDKISEHFVRESVKIIEESGFDIGTIVIDDKWMRFHGEKCANERKFPDFRGLIDELHAMGYRVILWYPVWWIDSRCETAINHPDYLIRDPRGKIKYKFDITNPDVREHIREMVEYWLSPDGYDADGLKLDFVYDCPCLWDELHDPSYGVGDELVLRMHELIYRSAKEAKRDSAVISISPNPFIAEWCDMIRLNDYFHIGIEGQLMRARVCSSICPHRLIDSDTYNYRRNYARYFAYASVYGVPAVYYVRRLSDELRGKMRDILRMYSASRNLRGEVIIDGNLWRRMSDGNVIIETDGCVLRCGETEITL